MSNGVALAYLAALVSGISVFVNSFGVVSMDATSYAFVRNLLVASILASLCILWGRWKEFLLLDIKQLLMLLFVGLFGGGVAFALFFSGLSSISGAEGSFIFRLLFIFSIIAAVVLFKEKINWKIALGAFSVILGNFLLLGPSSPLSYSTGSLLVLAATIIWAFEYALSKKLTATLSPLSVAAARMGIGALLLLAVVLTQGKADSLLDISPSSLGWIAISVGFLTLFVTLWYSALASTSLIFATAALTLGGPISALFSFAFAGKALLPLQAAGFLLLAFGAVVSIGAAETLSAAYWVKQKAKAVLRL
ncbi:MAG: DMT family transporter [Candidatus Anstonellaceae archaeon]